ncbi:serine/threonine-protein kinase StkP-like [Homarus americanus]|uniref:serine/threonine-protein kinase StkP-like n=1 Tax=Homarus americanus TaxID=6706 RepID=UPI001C484B61|nr:serine/threonine-protein kinase StkP-like [Homarus americanus]
MACSTQQHDQTRGPEPTIQKFSSEDVNNIMAKKTFTLLGTGTAGRCWRLTGDQTDLVLKQFTGKNNLKDLTKEVKYLHTCQGLEGVQKPVGVNIPQRYLFTKYSGLGLCNYARKYGFTVEVIDQIMLALCKVVQRLLTRGIAHNDIKPDNICLHTGDDGHHVTLIDFGMATLVNHPLYMTPIPADIQKQVERMAPEVLNGENITTTSDIYSLGKLFQKLVHTGEFPEEVVQWVHSAQNRDPICRPSLQSLIDILEPKLSQ